MTDPQSNFTRPVSSDDDTDDVEPQAELDPWAAARRREAEREAARAIERRDREADWELEAGG